MDSIAKTEQIRAIQMSRFISYLGRLDATSLKAVDAAIRITLAVG
jgi:mRNA-degrading endonuclease toxin of MazEF toxin-antitoxin module